ncbi:MAG: MoaD/ThiS family protein [Acidobacteria bacterium]|nr:MoaD/ThiS family protein [Acidobacteriota bacterium]MCA1608952.1 MoaD/ThiS family protein [Acidobacteriota bacterium]
MNITVLFFAASAEAAGTRSTSVAVEQPEKARSVFDRVVNDHPALQSHKLLFAINQQYSDGSEIVRDGDELAIFTHVSGG